MSSGSHVIFKCPYCPCMFSSQQDLDSHLKRFGNYDHLDLWRCVHIILEADGAIAGVDGHGDWHWGSKRKRVSRDTIRRCRAILAEHGFVL
jgi:hypothetical protein